LVEEPARSARASGQLPAIPLPQVVIERPRNASHGDYATAFALQSAKLVKGAPVKIAHALVEAMPAAEFLGRVELAGPGFINFTLDPTWLARQVGTIAQLGERFGSGHVGRGKRVQVEFVSANPTGPLHVASGRSGALGDALANVLGFAGYDVEREYYVNDSGSRMGAFYASAWARYLQQLGRPAEVPDDGYQGAYMIDLAKAIVDEAGGRYLELPPDEGERAVGARALEMVVAAVRED